MKILIADDQPDNRVLLNRVLEKKGHQILLAENGRQAVSVYKQQQPDLILMDIVMPDMDGIEAIRKIRSIQTEKWVQIIVISASAAEKDIVKGLEAGADDYITKPLNVVVLKSKILAIHRIITMQNELFQHKKSLLQYQQKNEIEQDFACTIFEKLIVKNDLNDAQLDYWVQPSNKFSGDLISAKRISDNQLYFMLADATGHGLSAALATIVVNQVFQAMGQKRRSISAIVREINARLNKELPTGHFVALAVGKVDTSTKTVEIWNGGLPPVMVLNRNSEITHSFPSKHIFCGVLNDHEFDDSYDTWNWIEKSELILHSDGVTDVINEKGSILGDQKLQDILLNTQVGKRIQGIKEGIKQHVDSNIEQDDISCLVMDCQ